MKANEAPEKIYLATTKEVQNLDTSFVGVAHSNPEDIVEPIEYVHKDAFIEKACDYLMEYEFNDSPTIADRRKRVDEFRKYIEGE